MTAVSNSYRRTMCILKELKDLSLRVVRDKPIKQRRAVNT